MPFASGGRLVVMIGVGLSELTDKLKTAENQLRSSSRRLGQAGWELTKALTVPIGIAGGAALKFAADFDKAMAQSLAIMGEVSDAMRRDLAETARDVAKETTFSARELAGAYYYLASAGMNATQSLAALPKVARFAMAGQFDLASATDLLTDAQSALGLKSKDARENLEGLIEVSDALVKANTLANASVRQFSEALTTRAGAALRQTNKGIEEGLAVLAVFADQGTKGAEAGTRLDIVLRELQETALKNRDAFRDYEVEVFDTIGRMRHMADIVEDLEKALGHLSVEGRRAAIMQMGFESRTVSALMQLIGFSKEIRRYDRELLRAGGTTEEVADKQLRNLSDQFTLVKNRAMDAGISIGKALAPAAEALLGALADTVSAVANVAKAIAKMPKWLSIVIAGFGGLLAAMGPALLVASKWPAILAAISVGATNLGAAFTFLAANPIGALLVAAGALVAVLSTISMAQTRVKAETDALADKMRKLERAVREAKEAFQDASSTEDELLAKLERRRAELARAEREYAQLGAAAMKEKNVNIMRLRFLENHVKALRGEITEIEKNEMAMAKLGVAMAGAQLKSAQLAQAEAVLQQELERGQKIVTATGDEIQGLGLALDAFEKHLRAIVDLLPEGDTKLKATAIVVQTLKERIAALREEQAKTETQVKSTTDVYKKWQADLELLTAEHLVFGDTAQFLQDEISATEYAIRDMIAAARAAGEPMNELFSSEQFQAATQRLRDLRGELKVFLGPELTEAQTAWREFVMGLQVTTLDLVESFRQAFSSMAQGIGNAVASVLVYGEDFAETMLSVLKNVLAQIIASLIRLGIEQLAFTILSVATLALETSAKLAAAAAQTYAAAYAAIIGPLTLMSLFAAPALAAAYAAGAVGTMLTGAAAAGKAGATAGAAVIPGGAKGGLAREPTLMMIAEAGPELLLPLDQLGGLDLGGRDTTVIFEMDSRELARATVPHIGSVVRKKIGHL